MKQKQLSTTYIIALSIIAVLVLIGTFVVHNSISNLTEDATVINVAGRQRMLSQKMTKVSLTMQQSADAASFNASKKELREALDLFTKSHNALQSGNDALGLSEPTFSETSKKLFKEINPVFESLRDAANNIAKLNFSNEVDANASVFQQNVPIILQNESAFLKTMNSVVTQFEKESKDKVDTLNIIVYSVAGAILITLFLLVVLFFQPIVVSIQKFITDIQNANDKLKDSEAEILKSSEKALEANEKMFFAQKDLQKMQATLKQSETLFRNVVENAPLVIFSLDKQGTFTLSEGQGLQDLGLKAGELVEKNAFEIYQDSPGMLADLEAVLNGGIPVESVTTLGEEYFENRFTPLKDQFGNVTGMVGISANVTDRQKFQEQLQRAEEETRKSLDQQKASNEQLIIAQEKIQESESYMRKALENSLEATENAYVLQKEIEKTSKKMKEASLLAKMGSWELEASLDGSNAAFTYSDEYFVLCGTSFAEYGSYTVPFENWLSDFTFEESHESLKAALGATLQNPIFAGEIEFLHKHQKTGEKIYTIAKITSKHENGKVKVLGTAQDITERKLAQQEIESSAAFQKGILESAGFGIIATDINGTIMSFNAAAEKLTGYSRIEMEGKESAAILHAIDEIVARTIELNKQYNEEMTPSFETFIYEANKDIVRAVEFTYVRKDKTTFPVYLTVSAIRDTQGNVTAYLGMVEDITEKKAIEIESKKRQARLAKQAQALSELSAINFSQIPLSTAYEYVTKFAAKGLDTERVSVWDYKTDKIISRKLFQRTENQFTAGTELFAKDFPKYFDELKTEIIIAADNAHTDRATAEFSEIYLKPLGIGAMLDIPIRLEGKMVGVLCNEHIGDARVWESDEVSFAKSVADIIALALEANKRQLVQKDLEEYSKELKQMFGVVQENEVKLDNALRLAKIGEFEFDLQNMTMSWSVSFWETVLETPKQENIGFEEFNKRFTYPEDIEKSNAQLDVVMQSTDPNFSNKFELRIVDTKGNIKTTEVTAKAPVRNSEGLPISLNGTIQDITERKAAEQLVNRLSLVASKTENAVIISNGAGLIEWVNESFTTVTEYTLEEVIGKKPGTFLQGELTDKAQVKLFRENLLTKKSFYQELYNYSKSGKGYWLGISITPILDAKGDVVQFIAIESDITERRAAEEIIEKANKDLVANEARLTSAMKELRVVQNQMIASAKNDKVLALKRGITEEEFEKSRSIDQYKDIDFSYIDDLKAKNLPVADNEADRLKALYDYDLLDTEAEEDLDGLTKLAAFVCGTPISLISLIDKDRQWFKSDYGLGAEQTARDIAFCHHAIMDTKVFEVEDAMTDKRFMNNPLVQGAPDIRFYAGAPLTTPDGFNIGTLCVIDKKTAKLTQEQKNALEVIASEVMARLESRRQNKIVLAINNKALAAFEELEKAQEEIQKNEQRFTNIAANTPDLIYQFFVNSEGRASFPYTSPAIEAIFELKPEDVKDDAMPLIALVAPEDRTRFQETVAISAEKMETFTYEGKFLTKSGKTKWIRAQAKPEMQNNGIMYNGTIVDITELKNAENDVKDALDMQKIINDSMIIAQRELAKKNDQLGKSEEEMRQIMERQLEANEQLMMAEKKIKSALDSELAGKEELERTYGTLKDAQSQLVHSEKMASLGQLTAGIAHEINNPINFVYNGIDTLKMSLDELLEIVEKYAELDKAEDKEKVLKEVQALKRQLSYGDLLGDINSLVGDIKKGAVRTMEIVKGLRVFSRLDEEEKKFANISECLDATLILLQNKFKGRVEVKKYYDDSMKEINCYPGQLNQVFMNIINNAIQSISEDRKDGLITIYTETQEQNVVIRIKDNGVGMSEQVKKRVFEPFFTTKAVGVGTGLGMSITFGIIEKHNGQIFVNSEEGKGTEFVIQIPKDLQ